MIQQNLFKKAFLTGVIYYKLEQIIYKLMIMKMQSFINA